MVFYRRCLNCTNTHKTIYYKRITPIPPGFSMYYQMVQTWTSAYNVLNLDFKLYSSYSDYSNDINAWTICNYDKLLPFPRDCGPSALVTNQWTGQSVNARNYAFYIGTESSTLQPTPEPTSPPASLMHLYTFNYGTAADLVGGSSWNGILGTEAQISEGSLVLTGASGSYMQIPANALVGFTTVTIELWVTTNSSNPGHCKIFQLGKTRLKNSYSVFLMRNASSPNEIILDSFYGNVESKVLTGVTFDGLVDAHMVVVFRPGISLTLYVNNVKFTGYWAFPSIPSSTAFYIGLAFDSSPMFIGSINEFRIYNGSLTDDQVSVNYAKGPAKSTSAPTPSLIPTLGPTTTLRPTQSSTLPLPTRKPSLQPTQRPNNPVANTAPALLPSAQCSPGKYFDFSVKACIQCSAGSFSTDGLQCTPCAKGWSSTAGASVCTICPGGTYSPSVGSVACLECPDGYKSSLAGSWNCTTCAEGFYVVNAITNVVQYNSYFYATLSNGPINGTVDSCQSGYVTLPYGWVIAPDTAESRTVIGSHSWSTDVVIVANNFAYSTASYSNPGTNQSCCANCLQAAGSASTQVESVLILFI